MRWRAPQQTRGTLITVARSRSRGVPAWLGHAPPLSCWMAATAPGPRSVSTAPSTSSLLRSSRPERTSPASRRVVRMHRLASIADFWAALGVGDLGVVEVVRVVGGVGWGPGGAPLSTAAAGSSLSHAWIRPKPSHLLSPGRARGQGRSPEWPRPGIEPSDDPARPASRPPRLPRCDRKQEPGALNRSKVSDDSALGCRPNTHRHRLEGSSTSELVQQAVAVEPRGPLWCIRRPDRTSRCLG